MPKNERTHLLIARLSAMGDVAMCVPAVKALREANPNLRITILTRPFFIPFFRDVPNLEFFDIDPKKEHKGIFGLMQLSEQLFVRDVTHMADLHDVLRTKVLRTLLRMHGIKCGIIDKGRTEKKLLTRKFRKFMNPLKPTVERYCDVFREMGFEVAPMVAPQKCPYPIPEPIEERTHGKAGEWIGVAPFAQHKGKIYPTLLTDQLIELLAKQYDKVFLFGGGPYERDFAECMEQRYKGVISVIGRLNLSQELDLISNIDTMVTMDSAAMHMASLVGTRVVSIWGATHPYAGFYGFGQDPADILSVEMPCRPCSIYGNKPCLYKDYRCLSAITPQMVSDRCALHAKS